MSAPRVGWVTCRAIPEHDEDERPAIDALRAAGLDAHALAWDDDDADLSGFDLLVLRSTWNYYRRPAEFAAWLPRAAAATRLLNPLEACVWNLHKGYLRALESAGVPIVPTVWADRGQRLDVPTLLRERGWDEVVVKPAISAASFGTRRFARHEADAAGAFLAELTAGGDAMLQPYLPGVEGAGEHSLVWIDGRWTHAVRKSPRLAGGRESVSPAVPIDPAMAQVAQRALAAAPGGLLYARADVMPTADGWVLSELELLEPSLFMVRHPPALEAFVSAVGARARTRR